MPLSMTRCAVLLAVGLAVAACGRAGDPLTPHQSAVKQAKKDGTTPPPKPVQEREFILDGLLD